MRRKHKEQRFDIMGNLTTGPAAYVGSFFSLREHGLLSTTSKSFNLAMKDPVYWNRMLKNPVAPDKNPKRVFLQNPDRRSKYVAFDTAGKQFIEEWVRNTLSINIAGFDPRTPLQAFLQTLFIQDSFEKIESSVNNTVVKLTQFLADGSLTLHNIRQWGQAETLMVAHTATHEDVAPLLADGSLTLHNIWLWGQAETLMVAHTATHEDIAPLLADGSLTLQNIWLWGEDRTLEYANEQNSSSSKCRLM